MLKNLKSLFFIEEEETEKPEEKKKTPDKPNPKMPPKLTPKSTADAGKASKAITETLLKAIEANNQSGFDYFEYKSALKSMEKMPMDEPTKFRSSFATASTLGVTMNKLVDSANFYLKVLANEETKFVSAAEQQFKNNIDNKLEEIELLKRVVASKNEQIKKLTDEINGHHGKLEGLNQHITDSKGKIEQTKSSFAIAYMNIKDQIEADIDKMKKYLK